MPDNPNPDDANKNPYDQALDALIEAKVNDAVKKTQINQSEPNKKKKWRNSWRSASPLTKAALIVSGFVALATIANSIAAGIQSWTMGKQLEEMKGGGQQTERLLELNAKALEQITKQAGAASNSYEAQARPYIGLQGVAVRPEKDGHPREIRAAIKNFGIVPALNVIFQWKGLLDGKPMPARRIPDAPKILYPTDSMFLSGGFTEGHSSSLFKGNSSLIVFVKVHYEWREYKSDECRKYRYEPIMNNFFDLGPLCGNWDAIPYRFQTEKEAEEDEKLDLQERQQQP